MNPTLQKQRTRMAAKNPNAETSPEVLLAKRWYLIKGHHKTRLSSFKEIFAAENVPDSWRLLRQLEGVLSKAQDILGGEFEFTTERNYRKTTKTFVTQFKIEKQPGEWASPSGYPKDCLKRFANLPGFFTRWAENYPSEKVTTVELFPLALCDPEFRRLAEKFGRKRDTLARTLIWFDEHPTKVPDGFKVERVDADKGCFFQLREVQKTYPKGSTEEISPEVFNDEETKRPEGYKTPVVVEAPEAPPVGTCEETLPVETLPVETLPVETLPVETLPVETLPVETCGDAPYGYTYSGNTKIHKQVLALRESTKLSDAEISQVLGVMHPEHLVTPEKVVCWYNPRMLIPLKEEGAVLSLVSQGPGLDLSPEALAMVLNLSPNYPPYRNGEAWTPALVSKVFEEQKIPLIREISREAWGSGV